MTPIKTLCAAAIGIMSISSAALAGGFSPAVEGVAVEIVEPEAAPAGSLPGWVVPVLIMGVLIALAQAPGATDDQSDQ